MRHVSGPVVVGPAHKAAEAWNAVVERYEHYTAPGDPCEKPDCDQGPRAGKHLVAIGKRVAELDVKNIGRDTLPEDELCRRVCHAGEDLDVARRCNDRPEIERQAVDVAAHAVRLLLAIGEPKKASTEPTLKSCPVCGKLPTLVVAGQRKFMCEDCGIVGAWHSQRSGAINAWNAAVDAYEPLSRCEQQLDEIGDMVEFGPDETSVDGVRRLIEERDGFREAAAKANEELVAINAEFAVAPTGTLTQAVRLLQRERDGAVRSNRALEATVEAYQCGTGTHAERLRDERDEALGQLRSIAKCFGKDTTNAGAVLMVRQVVDELQMERQKHGGELLRIANAMGLKSTGGLVQSAKILFEDVKTLKSRLSESRQRTLERRMRHIVNTAEGLCDDEIMPPVDSRE
jgi:hypothetical protein